MRSLAWARALCVLPIVYASVAIQPVSAAAPVHASTNASVSHSSAEAVKAQRTTGAPVNSAPSYNSFGLTREVFGYAYGGSLGDPNVGYPSWNFNLLSTVAFFSIRVDYNGVLVADSNWTVWDGPTLAGLVSTAHQHGVKVVVTLTPVYHDLVDFCNMLYEDNTTVIQIVKQVQQKGIDGVNIDYENQLGQCNPTNPGLTPMTDQALLTRFAKDLRAGLDAAKPGYYLSIATYSGSASGPDGFFNIPALNQYVDSFFVMAYDMDYANQGSAPLNCSSFCMAPVSPMTGYYWNDTTSMNQYAAVVGPGKTILGQPYYGRVSCVSSPAAHATATSSVDAATYIGAANVVSSSDVRPGSYSINRDPNDPIGLDRWDAWYDNYYGCWREMHWSDTTTLGARYDLINQDNLRGVGIWTLSYGGSSAELWNALWTHFVLCASGTLSSNVTPPAPAGSAIAFTAGTSGCLSPQFEFWVQYPDGNWYLKQGWGGPTFNWDTTGLAPGTYTMHSWANRSGSSWETFGSETVTLTGCTTASLTPSNPTAPAGTAVGLTATSGGGCPTPVYEFWVQYPDGSWNLKQGWGSGTFNWDTTGLLPGTYTVHGWANQQGAAQTLESYGSSTVTLTGCTSASLTPPGGTIAGGTVVNFTAQGSGGCPTAVYEFWVQYPNGSWNLKQGWGAATFNWDTSTVAPGTYTIHAWANAQGAAPTLEAYGSATLTITGCSSASLSPSNPSQPAGSTVALTAGVSGCVNSQFEFWVQYPNGSWSLKQGWGGATFNWDTTGLGPGTYIVHSWTNRSGTSWETYGSATVTLTGCTSASVSPATGSGAVGSSVTFTVTPAGCPTASYEFWLLDPAGTWHLELAWGTANTWTWNTAGWAKGTYTLHVWTNSQGASTSTYQTIGSAAFTLS